jgi:hypothetical protein
MKNNAFLFAVRELIPKNPPFGGEALGRLKLVTPTKNGSRSRPSG